MIIHAVKWSDAIIGMEPHGYTHVSDAHSLLGLFSNENDPSGLIGVWPSFGSLCNACWSELCSMLWWFRNGQAEEGWCNLLGWHFFLLFQNYEAMKLQMDARSAAGVIALIVTTIIFFVAVGHLWDKS